MHHSNTKYIGIHHNITWKKINMEVIDMMCDETKHMLVDMLTKALI
jgi:hypothetical protein